MSKIATINADLDGFIWVRDTDGNLCGPYDTEAEARADFRPGQPAVPMDPVSPFSPEQVSPDPWSQPTEPDEPECMNGPDGCQGATEYRAPLSGTGKSFARCDAHWEARLEAQQGINERYPQQQPADFDPSYAGESWDET